MKRQRQWQRSVLDKILAFLLPLFLIIVIERSPSYCRNGVLSSRRQWPAPSGQKVAIVITDDGGQNDLFSCLDSWHAHTVNSFVFLVDESGLEYDGPWLERLALSYSNLTIVTGRKHIGNAGFHAAVAAGFQYIVRLQSDAVLTSNWLPPLIAVLEQRPSVGAVAPLSNSGQWQPSLLDLSTTNASETQLSTPLLSEWQADWVSKLAFLLTDNRLLEMPFLHSMATAFRSEVFRTEGIFEDELFSADSRDGRRFSALLANRGWKQVVVPASYVHQTQPLGAAKRAMKAAMGGAEQYAAVAADLEDAEKSFEVNKRLQEMQARLQGHLPASLEALRHDTSALFILNAMSTKSKFVLRSSWVSLVQEALGLWQNGFYVRLAVPLHLLPELNSAFPRANSAGIFIGFQGMTPEAVADELLSIGTVYDFVVATHPSTAFTVARLCSEWPNTAPAYFVEDNESNSEAMAESFKAIGVHALTLVNTRWLHDQLYEEFHVNSVILPPSVDTEFFKPARKIAQSAGPLNLCAMVSVFQPKQYPFETLKIMTWAMTMFGAEKVNATVFGCSRAEINEFLIQQNNSYVKKSVLNILGALNRYQMQSVLQRCDLFLDFSAWRAFGRMGLEAAASGAVPIMPNIGGRNEFSVPGINAFFIDTSDDSGIHTLLHEIANGEHDLVAMRKAAVASASKYSLTASSKATAMIFREFWQNWRAQRSQAYSS